MTVITARRRARQKAPPQPEYEKVNHPAHYGGADNPYEAIKVIEAWGLGFNLGTLLRYVARHGTKPGEDAIDDLRKAAWYLNREIETLVRERADVAGESK